MSIRQSVRKAILRSSTYRRYYRRQHRDVLTVVAFHRVLDERDPLFGQSNPLWTMSLAHFEQTIAALEGCFTFVSAEAVHAGYLRGLTLPPNPLLLTFDDGWADNYRYAFPLLSARGISAVFFVTTDSIGSRRYFWQEALYAALSQPLRDDFLRGLILHALPAQAGRVLSLPRQRQVGALLGALGRIDTERREVILNEFQGIVKTEQAERVFLDGAEICAMRQGGMVIGSHGKTHQPLGQPEGWHEFTESRVALGKILGEEIEFFSWPHGIYTPESLAECRRAGYSMGFCSDRGLNRVGEGGLFTMKRHFFPTWRYERGSDGIRESILLDLR